MIDLSVVRTASSTALDDLTLISLLDCVLMASKGVVSGSGPSIANGRFVDM